MRFPFPHFSNFYKTKQNKKKENKYHVTTSKANKLSITFSCFEEKMQNKVINDDDNFNNANDEVNRRF